MIFNEVSHIGLPLRRIGKNHKIKPNINKMPDTASFGLAKKITNNQADEMKRNRKPHNHNLLKSVNGWCVCTVHAQCAYISNFAMTIKAYYIDCVVFWRVCKKKYLATVTNKKSLRIQLQRQWQWQWQWHGTLWINIRLIPKWHSQKLMYTRIIVARIWI